MEKFTICRHKGRLLKKTLSVKSLNTKFVEVFINITALHLCHASGHYQTYWDTEGFVDIL